MKIGELCAGYGGLGIGIQAVLGGRIAWMADNDPGIEKILAHRFPGVPSLGDISQTEWGWEEPPGIVAAGFPCQDVSCAGQRKGLRAGTRTGVWTHVARAIDELRPPLVVLENVRGLLSAGADSNMEPCPWCVGEAGHKHSLRAAGAVLGDLASLGYDAVWRTVPASAAGAPHDRKRVFILGWDTANTRDQEPHQAHPALPAPDIRAAPGWGDGEPGAGAAANAQGIHGRRGKPGDLGSPPAADEGSLWLAEERPESGDGTDLYPELTGLQGAAGEGVEGEGWPPGIPAGGPGGDGGWGKYGPAIERWAAVLGRPAPAPAEPGRTGPRLSATFVEWMMGLPAGWVTAVPGLSRRDQLKALGNGVVPQQAALAMTLLLVDAAQITGNGREIGENHPVP